MIRIGCFCLLLGLISGPTTPALSEESEGGYEFIAKWGNFGDAYPQGEFWLYGPGPDGKDHPPGRYCDGPERPAVDPHGYLYVADSFNCRIQKFTTAGEFITVFGSKGCGNGQFRRPCSVAVDGEGKVYVVDGFNHRIQKFNPDGSFLIQWGSQGSQAGQFYFPTDVAIGPDGSVYVADGDNDRIQKFGPEGTFLQAWGSAGRAPGQLRGPTGIAADTEGNLFVADAGNHRIQKFTSNGEFVTLWGSRGKGNGQFYFPTDLDVDREGNVFVSDSIGQCIQKFRGDGAFLTRWGREGPVGACEDGLFKYPSGVAVDPEGNVYVTDSGPHGFLDTWNGRIQKFGPKRSPGEVLRPQPPTDNPRWPQELRLTVKDPLGKGRTGFVTCGLPYPPGVLEAPSRLTLRAARTGTPIPLQTSTLVRWPDGSIKWLLVTFVGTSRPGDNTFLLTVPGNPPQVENRIQISHEQDGSAVVRTGPLELRFRNGQTGLWDRLLLRRKDRLTLPFGPSEPRFSLRTADGHTQPIFPVASGFEIEESGPLRAVIHVRRIQPLEDGDIDYSARIYCYTGQPGMRIDLTFTNCSHPGAIQFQGEGPLTPERGIKEVVGLPLVLQLSDGISGEVRVGRSGQSPWEHPPASIVVLQDTDQHYTIIQGNEALDEGKQVEGWIQVGPVTLGCREFWQQFPKSFRYQPSSRQLTLDLCLAPSEEPWPLYPGVAKTHQLVLHFGDGPGADIGLHPLIGCAPPSELLASQAVPLFGQVDEENWPQFEHIIGDSYHSWLRFAANGKSPGIWHYGDPGGNGYHGQDYDLLLHYFRTGDPTLLQIASAAARHRADLDIMHYPGFYRGKHCHGYSPVHWDPSHRRIANIMSWTSGLYYYYCLTGDRRASEVLAEVGDWLTANRVRYPSRECYLPLGWMSEIAEVTGRPEHQETVRYLYRYLRDTIPYPGDGVQPMPFMAGSFGSGMLADSLYRYWSATGDESVIPVVARLCRWVYEDYGTPSGAIRYHTDPTQGLAIDYYNHGETTSLAGVTYTLTGNLQHLRYGLGRLEYYLQYTPFGWPLGMSSGLHQLQWACQQAGLTEADLGIEPWGGFEEAISWLQQTLKASQGLEDETLRTMNVGCLTIELVRTLTNAGRYDEALAALEEYLGDTERGQAWWMERMNAIARVHWRKGDYEAADQAYRAFLEGLGPVADPATTLSLPHVHCWWHIAQCAEKLGDREGALEAYRECARYTWSRRGKRAAERLTGGNTNPGKH